MFTRISEIDSIIHEIFQIFNGQNFIRFGVSSGIKY